MKKSEIHSKASGSYLSSMVILCDSRLSEHVCLFWRCNEECPVGTYGEDCKDVCDCANGARCYNIHGGCLCEPGFKGPRCDHRMCPDGIYGMHCEQRCLCNSQNTLRCAVCFHVCYWWSLTLVCHSVNVTKTIRTRENYMHFVLRTSYFRVICVIFICIFYNNFELAFILMFLFQFLFNI